MGERVLRGPTAGRTSLPADAYHEAFEAAQRVLCGIQRSILEGELLMGEVRGQKGHPISPPDVTALLLHAGARVQLAGLASLAAQPGPSQMPVALLSAQALLKSASAEMPSHASPAVYFRSAHQPMPSEYPWADYNGTNVDGNTLQDTRFDTGVTACRPAFR